MTLMFWLKGKGKAAITTKPSAEAGWMVTLGDDHISCARPDGAVERVKWDDLPEVTIVTTDEGPYVPDIWWVLGKEEGGCIIPLGATGKDQLVERLQALPGFNNAAMIEAMSSSSNATFTC